MFQQAICLVLLVIVGLSSQCKNPIVPPKNATALKNPLAIPSNATQYANSVMAGSNGACPVKISSSNYNESIALINYFVVDTKGNKSKISTAYQYQSLKRNIFRYDEIFLLDNTDTSGQQIFEYARNNGSVFFDVALQPNGSVVCVSASKVPIPFYTALFTKTSRYIGIVHFQNGTFNVDASSQGYDVYEVPNFWILPTTVLFFYVNRATGILEIQLYHQSAGGGPNYFWDFTKVMFGEKEADAKFSANYNYYFGLPKYLVSLCPKK